MAGRAGNKTENEVNTSVEVDYKEQADKLQSELNELKDMMKLFMANQPTTASVQSEKAVLDKYEEELELIQPNKLINVTSLFYGGMTLKGNNDKPFRFETFGITRPISFDDLTHICSQYRHYAETGLFFIHNSAAVKALYLEQYYKTFIDKNTIENILNLTDEEIKSVFSTLSNELKETVSDVVLAGVKQFLLGQDKENKYGNRNKIALISDLCGYDIFARANDQINHDK